MERDLRTAFASLGISLTVYLFSPDILDKKETVLFIFTIAFLSYVLIMLWQQVYEELIWQREERSIKRSRELFHKPEYRHPDLITLKKGQGKTNAEIQK